MPEIPRMSPGRRVFARIDKFECSCPHCGEIVFAAMDGRYLTATREKAQRRPKAVEILKLFWDPYTQRFKCPWCNHVYTVGVVFYPARPSQPRVHTPAPDCKPTAAEVAEMRRLASGWLAEQGRHPQDDANLVVTASCSCPTLGTAPDCPLHGEQTLQAAEDPRYRPRRRDPVTGWYLPDGAALSAGEGGESPSATAGPDPVPPAYPPENVHLGGKSNRDKSL